MAPAELRDKKTGPEASGEKIDKLDAAHPALQIFADPILLESLKSSRVWGYTRASARGRPLISLAERRPAAAGAKSRRGQSDIDYHHGGSRLDRSAVEDRVPAA